MCTHISSPHCFPLLCKHKGDGGRERERKREEERERGRKGGGVEGREPRRDKESSDVLPYTHCEVNCLTFTDTVNQTHEAVYARLNFLLTYRQTTELKNFISM